MVLPFPRPCKTKWIMQMLKENEALYGNGAILIISRGYMGVSLLRKIAADLSFS